MFARKYQTHICQTSILPCDGDGWVDFPRYLLAHIPCDPALRTAAEPHHPYASDHPSQLSFCYHLQRAITSLLMITGLCRRDIPSPSLVRLQATVKTRLARHPGCKLSARGQVLSQSRQIRQSGAKRAAARGKAGSPSSSPSQPGAWLESTRVAGSAGRSLLLTPLWAQRVCGCHTGCDLLNSQPSGKGKHAGTCTPPAREPETVGSASGPDSDSAGSAIPSCCCYLYHRDTKAFLAS